MLRQYLEIKGQYEDCILFFRLGDFYEMFYEDALTASKVLEITLTGKNVGADRERAPLCGVPYHSAEGYIAKLVENGYKVAICEQTEDPKLTKGLVRREVVRVVTPGTVTGDAMLRAERNNYLAAVYEGDGGIGIAWCDITTGELCAAEAEARGAALAGQLSRIDAAEILLNENAVDAVQVCADSGAHLSFLPEEYFTEERGRHAREALSGDAQFPLQDPDGEDPVGGAIRKAADGLFSYLSETAMGGMGHIKPLRIASLTGHMLLDRASIRNLELTETLMGQDVKGTLLGVLDRTRTAMGGRLLKRWLKEPLIEVDAIERRLNAVEWLLEDVLARNHVREALKAVYDLERLSGRVSFGNANARDLLALRRSAGALPEIKGELAEAPKGGLLSELDAQTDDLEDLSTLVASAIEDEPPATVREGGMIRAGFSDALDQLKESIRGGQEWIAALEQKERDRTGIKTLKVGYNKVFGYYIEITHANAGLVPAEYIRKQTLVGSERYITPEMKEVESVVLGAEARIHEMEYEIFCELRGRIRAMIPLIQRTSDAVATIDVLASFADVAEKNNYSKPVMDGGDVIQIEKGRHPVIEHNLSDRSFVPNDVYLDRKDRSMLLITGPNMAGKSTYMRQTALIVLLAQAGCFVPAERARIGICDRLFTRIGASDNLAKGESTFFVEMRELAYILNTATERSLVILDEIGRGTSTYDGLAIAWAVIDCLCGLSRSAGAGSQVRCLFATHYHELTALEGKLPGFANLNTEIADSGEDVVFLHRISEGSASRSYGIHVAKIAGVPQDVIEDAVEKLALLEPVRQELDAAQVRLGAQAGRGAEGAASGARPEQISLFDFAPNPVMERLKALDLMEITPSKAYALLEELQAAAKGQGGQ
jgi:DNA mismatch repair protein MutS